MEEKENILPQQQNTFSRGGSDPTAASGGNRERSEWPRSSDDAAAPSARNMPGTATGNGGTANAVTEAQRRNGENSGKSDAQKNVSDSRPHSSSVSFADSFPPGEAIGAVEAVAQRQYEIWRAQAQEAKNLYPGLDMSRELRDPRFAHLLKSGVDVRTAFEVVHRDQILPAAMHAAARAVERKLTRAMAGERPAESAMQSASAALTKTDVAAMSRADRAEIIRRVRQGEKIRF